MQLLFSYGTLQLEAVQVANFGRKLTGHAGTLPGYIVGKVKITDERVLKESGKEYHPILQYTGNMDDKVTGTVFELSDQELLQADDYEVDDYKRVRAQLVSGISCWIYAATQDNSKLQKTST
jgi:gamma-glutamylcyclotransferase (GGCT)/AIG2-like uncharacterized protein YtfP